MKVIEGVSVGGLKGSVLIESKYIPDGWEREMNGHVQQQHILVHTCWFHPYCGAAPFQCDHPNLRRASNRINDGLSNEY